MKNTLIRRGAAALIVLATAATTALFLPSTAAHAADPLVHKYVQVGVTNNAGAPLDIAFAVSADKLKGQTAPGGKAGTPALPSAPVALSTGSSTSMYGIDLIGGLDWSEHVGFIYTFANHFNVQVSSPTGSDLTQATLTHDGRVYGQTASDDIGVTLAGASTPAYLLRLNEIGSPDSGFVKKYQLTVEANAATQTTPINSPLSGDQTFIAGEAAGRHGMTDKRCDVANPVPCAPVALTPSTDHRLRCTVIPNDPQEEFATVTIGWPLYINGVRYDIDGPSTGDIPVRTDANGRLTVDAGGLSVQCSAAARTVSYDATRMTGSAATNPVYKITVDGYQRKFTTLPSELQVDIYTVRGRTAPNGYGDWQNIGTLVPVGKPRIDRATKVITYQPATFYFENTAGNTQYYALSITAPGVAGSSTELAQVAAPPVDLDQKTITTMTVTTSTGLPVVANGVAQEQLKVKLIASGEVVDPDDQPGLNRLYDYIYYRDPAGKLITGLYASITGGGYTSISTTRGGYVNELGTTTVQADPSRVYLSTTHTSAPRITAHLDVTAHRQSAEVKVERSAASDTAGGTARHGIILNDGVLDPTSGAFHHYNGERAGAAVLTRYKATPTVSSLPTRTPYTGQFMAENGGHVAYLNTTDALDGVAYLCSQLVNLNGTYVTLPSLAVG